MKKIMLIISILVWVNHVAHGQDYGFIGSDVDKVNTATNEVVDTGKLLMDIMLSPEEVKKVSVRYAPNTEILNQQGNPVVVQRIMDFYYPTPELKFIHEGNEITSLPVIVMLHSGQGTRLTIAPQAMDMARRGYTVLVPTYRSDRSLVNYCIGFQATVYGMVQDFRAATKLYVKAREETVNVPIEIISDLYGQEIADFVSGLQESRSDAHSLIFSGYSGGGTAGLNVSMRIHQEQFPFYLPNTEPYIITGALGEANLGQRGTIDEVGIPYSLGAVFPVDRLKGTISRTVGIDDLELINFQNHPNPVPVCFIHGTCDTAIPYLEAQLIGVNELCDARITHPDGSEENTVSIYGSQPVSEAIAQAGGYADLLTFCGGGHTSNQCVTELVNQHMFQFIKRVLVDDYDNGQLFETVYRYLPENYSNQCCALGDLYKYIEKCSCDESNTIEVIDLPYTSQNACQYTASCSLIDYCNLGNQPEISIPGGGELKIIFQNNEAALQYFSSNEKMTRFEIYDYSGHLIHEELTLSQPGLNYFPIPVIVKSRQFHSISVDRTHTLKFVLQ